MADYSKASWVDPSQNWTPLPVSELPERVLIDFATKCNLRCPMCPVWGSEDNNAIDSVKGIMKADAATRLLDEIAPVQPLIQPNMYGEPLLIPNLRERLRDMKARGIAIAFNTNGLTLDEDLAKYMVEVELEFDFVQHRRADAPDASENPRHRQAREDRSGRIPHVGGARRPRTAADQRVVHAAGC